MLKLLMRAALFLATAFVIHLIGAWIYAAAVAAFGVIGTALVGTGVSTAGAVLAGGVRAGLRMLLPAKTQEC